tara:strand:- start:509 stop:652 length:144 start_codon:yes stop_codon:yes gene_type:complete
MRLADLIELSRASAVRFDPDPVVSAGERLPGGCWRMAGGEGVIPEDP